MTQRSDDFHAVLDRFEARLPNWLAPTIRRLLAPGAIWLRVPAALILIAAGFVGFLPILGFWMIPLGLILIAIDLPFLRPPLAKGLTWIESRIWLSK